jgi:hypothetical protein
MKYIKTVISDSVFQKEAQHGPAFRYSEQVARKATRSTISSIYSRNILHFVILTCKVIQIELNTICLMTKIN